MAAEPRRLQVGEVGHRGERVVERSALDGPHRRRLGVEHRGARVVADLGQPPLAAGDQRVDDGRVVGRARAGGPAPRSPPASRRLAPTARRRGRRRRCARPSAPPRRPARPGGPCRPNARRRAQRVGTPTRPCRAARRGGRPTSQWPDEAAPLAIPGRQRPDDPAQPGGAAAGPRRDGARSNAWLSPGCAIEDRRHRRVERDVVAAGEHRGLRRIRRAAEEPQQRHVVHARRVAASRPSASAPRNDSQHVRNPCSIGWPVPRSVASDSAIVSSARRPEPASSATTTLCHRWSCGRATTESSDSLRPRRRRRWEVAEREFDVVVIGAGAAGEVAAGRLGEAGLAVAIVEERLVGGECSFYACMPSKALLRPVELAAEARRVPGVADRASSTSRAVLARRDEVVHDLDDSRGAVARGARRRRSSAATGGSTESGASRSATTSSSRGARWSSRPAARRRSRRPGPRATRAPWTNIEATTAKEVPGAALRARRRRRRRRDGAGLVGVRLAGHARPPRRPADRARGAVRERAGEDALREGGVDVRLGTSVAAVSRNGAVRVELDDGERVEADELLVAIGRTPRDHDIGLETVGLEPGEHVEVDERSASPAATGCTRSATSTARAAHAHGQVPGPARRRRDPRPGRRAALRRRARRRA